MPFDFGDFGLSLIGEAPDVFGEQLGQAWRAVMPEVALGAGGVDPATVATATGISLTPILERIAGWARWIDPVLQRAVPFVGALGMGYAALQAGRQQRMLERAQRESLRALQQQRAVAAPAAQAAAALVPAGTAALLGGALPVPLEARVGERYRTLLAQLLDQFARAGIPHSTARALAEAQARQLQELERADLASQLLGAGTATTAAAVGAEQAAGATARGLEQSITGQLGSTSDLLRRAQHILTSYLGTA